MLEQLPEHIVLLVVYGYDIGVLKQLLYREFLGGDGFLLAVHGFNASPSIIQKKWTGRKSQSTQLEEVVEEQQGNCAEYLI